VSYRFLIEFESLFTGHPYLHRDSSLGDFVAIHLYEDMVGLGKSAKLNANVSSREWVLNTANKRQGVKARRGDGTFGELVPGADPTVDPGYFVARGPVATVEIGVEVKILQQAMIKQIDRVIGDLLKQISHFKRGGGNPICVGVVGINHAEYCTGYEGTRSYRTDGRSYRHPIQEAAQAEHRLTANVAQAFDEFIILRYRAENEPPFSFAWVDRNATDQDYGAALLRLCREYDRRFA